MAPPMKHLSQQTASKSVKPFKSYGRIITIRQRSKVTERRQNLTLDGVTSDGQVSENPVPIGQSGAEL